MWMTYGNAASKPSSQKSAVMNVMGFQNIRHAFGDTKISAKVSRTVAPALDNLLMTTIIAWMSVISGRRMRVGWDREHQEEQLSAPLRLRLDDGHW